jgi:hypothetical protein
MLVLAACHFLLWLIAGDINKDQYGREQNGIVMIWVMARLHHDGVLDCPVRALDQVLHNDVLCVHFQAEPG